MQKAQSQYGWSPHNRERHACSNMPKFYVVIGNKKMALAALFWLSAIKEMAVVKRKAVVNLMAVVCEWQGWDPGLAVERLPDHVFEPWKIWKLAPHNILRSLQSHLPEVRNQQSLISSSHMPLGGCIRNIQCVCCKRKCYNGHIDNLTGNTPFYVWHRVPLWQTGKSVLFWSGTNFFCSFI